MSEPTKVEVLTDNLKVYLNTNEELLKLEALERLSTIGAETVSYLIVGVVAMLFVFFLSFGIGFFLSTILDNNYSGFGIVAGFYLLLGLILFLGKNKLMTTPLRNKFIGSIFLKH